MIQRLEMTGPHHPSPLNRAVPGPALRAGIKAQARHYHWAVPGTGTMGLGLGRFWAVLVSAVSVPAQRAWPIWPGIACVERLPPARLVGRTTSASQISVSTVYRSYCMYVCTCNAFMQNIHVPLLITKISMSSLLYVILLIFNLLT